ncbi:transcriptional regulator, LysR family [Leptothrix cholodnii SP-6]|uniref:Transcriptional regulator, LysR family n=1 Tax=Leptothrix cholodnii (strain ATCC 51168 / LMG 8142 / SP-6) TaxID=395495 RepID=B1XX68_LEPCP|nr:LysR family transcriptional regulator [Leptothrix cholodnii]ACB32714.1 transcriptional regulator, LysR family [Leptothrix cholodnii SP-6]
MRDLDLKSLRLLVAVCDCQNIKLAAQQEHIEPSAISKRIAQLEATLGTPLLVRGRRGVLPTPAGLALLEHARTLLDTLERIETDVAAYAGGLRGHVRLVASVSAIAESLLDDVALFMRDPDNRGIRIDIEERLSTDVVRLVRDGRASIGVCWDSVDLAGLSHVGYRRDQLVLAVHPEHELASRRSLRFEQTLAHEHVGLPPTTAVYSMLHRAAARAGRTLVNRVVVSNFDAALRVVRANLGLSVIPMQVSRSWAASGEIVAIPLLDGWAQRRFAVCFRERGALTPAAARLVDFLVGRAEAAEAADGVEPAEPAGGPAA